MSDLVKEYMSVLSQRSELLSAGGIAFPEWERLCLEEERLQFELLSSGRASDVPEFGVIPEAPP